MSSTPPTTSGAARPIVLVHGAWFGAFCWERVIAAIGDSDRVVLAVELTGSGARARANGPHITLEDHVADVVEVIERDHLDHVVLVGHSYGGRVITGVVARIPDRIARVVYIDAHAPVTDDPGPSPQRRAAASANNGMLPFDGVRLDADLVGGGVALERVRSMLVDHSFATLTAPWRHELPAHIERTYVHALQPDGEPFARYATVCRDDPAWDYIEIDGPHMLVYSHPEQLASIIAR